MLAAQAGCSRMLSRTLAAAAQGNGRLSTERGYAANRPAVALEVQHGRGWHMTLYISPRGDRPLVAIVDRYGEQVTARIYLQPVRRRILAQFHLFDRVKPEPKR
jgi:hypothetical protein